jgi:hypothetical protein
MAQGLLGVVTPGLAVLYVSRYSDRDVCSVIVEVMRNLYPFYLLFVFSEHVLVDVFVGACQKLSRSMNLFGVSSNDAGKLIRLPRTTAYTTDLDRSLGISKGLQRV